MTTEDTMILIQTIVQMLRYRRIYFHGTNEKL